jgi:molybdopterin/thiamine biosynthesis adenylyltransferase
MKELDILLRESSASCILSWSQEKALAETTGISLREIEERALTLGILPMRYKRNRNSFSIKDQHRLLRSRVAVIGCGGLGGFVIEELCRLGVGAIQAWDYDDFAEHNLNRQVLLTIDLIGQDTGTDVGPAQT